MKGQPESELVRHALESYLAKQRGAESAFDAAVAAGVIDSAKTAPRMPRDLSTNPKYFEDFGRSE